MVVYNENKERKTLIFLNEIEKRFFNEFNNTVQVNDNNHYYLPSLRQKRKI